MSDQHKIKAWETPWKTGLAGRCPCCGKASAFSALLTLKERCEVCDFDLADADPGDGPAVFAIFILGTFATLLALWMAFSLGMSMPWIVVISSIVIIVGSIWLLRLIKGVLITLQFRHDAHEARLVQDGEE